MIFIFQVSMDQIEADNAASELLDQMDKATDKAVTAGKILAKSAAKKGVKTDSLPAGTTTRKAAKLAPPSAATKFTLQNLAKAKTIDELKFQLQENVSLIENQFVKMELPMHDRAMMLAFMLKEFQRLNLFCNCDNMVYHLAGNTVSLMSIYSCFTFQHIYNNSFN